MQSDDPPFLCLGTEVSAKFKGAFCEAKVKKLIKSIKCKVNLGSEFGTAVIEDKDIRGAIILNGNVDVVHNKHLRPGVIQHIKDCSQYTVVFNDGDEKDLRRTQVCLKSGRHFEPEVSLDSLPLYNPEHFSNPVVHGNKKRNRQVSVERTPRKRKAKEEDEDEEEEEVEKRKKRRAAHVATAAMAGQGESTEEEQEEEDDEGSEEESEREKEKSEKKKAVKTPEPTPTKKRKDDKEEEKRKKEKEKEEEKKRKEREDKRKEKEKEELKRKKEKEEERRKEEEKEKERERKEKKEKEEKKTKSEEKAEKVKKFATPKKAEKEKDKPESSTPAKEKTIIEEDIKKPGIAVVVTVHKEGNAIYYPALTTSLDAYKKYEPGSIKQVSERQVIVRSLCTDAYVRVGMAHLVLFESFDKDEFSKGKMGSKLKAAIGMATAWNQKKRLPKEWTLAQVFGDAEAKRIKKEKVKKLREEEKRKEEEEERKKEEERKRKEDEEKKRLEEEEEEEERKAKEEAERKKKKKEEEKKEKEKEKEKEREKKEKEKEKEKKAKKQAEVEDSDAASSESSEDDEADYEERDIFTAQLYKFHEERNTPINKAPVWGGKDLDLHKLYRYVVRYGGSKKCTDSGTWKKILLKLGLGGTGAQGVNLKKAYARYLNEFHSTYSQLGWSLEDLSTKIVSGGRSAKKVIDYGFRKKRRQRTDNRQSKQGEKDESIRSEETAENEEERDVKKEEEEESVPPVDVSSTETHSRRSLSRITNSESPMPSTSTATPAKRVRKGKGSKEESVVRTMSECTEPALMPAVGEDTLSTVSSSLAPPFRPSSFSPSLDGASWFHDDVKDAFLPANILTHFYQGMSVRALHSGQWYGARVVQVHQPSIKAVTEAIERAAGGHVKPEPGEAFGLSSLDELREMAKKIRCLVHYLGWNSRYDEYMRLPQIRISQKDDDASMRMAKPKLSENLLGWVAKWSRTREGMTALCGPLDSPKAAGSSSMAGLGGYRPRRVSFSQYEQLSTSATSPMGGAVSPSMSERERRERMSEERAEKMKSEEREEEREGEVVEEEVRPVTPVVEKKEKKKGTKKEEKEKKEDVKEEESGEREETKKHVEKKPKKEKEDIELKVIKAPRRTPSPVKLSSLPSTSSVDAAPAPLPVSPAVDAIVVATQTSFAAAAATAPSTSAAAAAVEEKEKEGGKKSCSISDTIDEVVQLLGSRAEKEKKEKKEREERERKEAEKARKEEEAAAALAAKFAAKQKQEEEAARLRKEEQEKEDAAALEKRKEEEKVKKEVRFEKPERKKVGKDKEKEPEVKGKKKVQKEEEAEKKKGAKKIVLERKMEEVEEEAMDDEDEEFERLHGEAKALGVLLPDLPKEQSESPEKMEEGEKKEMEKLPVTPKEEPEERYHSDSSAKTISTTIDKSAPPSSSKAKKRKKRGNQSNMVLDRKYSKKSKKEEEDESDEEDAAVLSERPPHATLSVLKSRMLKAMEADGSLNDFSPLGLPHITQTNLYGERVVANWTVLEKHAEELRDYYYGVRAELAKLEKRNKATIKRRIEKDRAEKEERKAAKEAAAAAATADAPSTSAAAAALIAEI